MASTPKDLLTIGYSGHDHESFIWLLRRHETEVLVDVRRSAVSRNRFFAKSALQAALREAGITYLHMPELGVAADLRAGLKRTGDFESYTKEYRRHLRRERSALERLCELVTTNRCCLMCMEQDQARCHRSILAEHVSKMNGEQIPIVNL